MLARVITAKSMRTETHSELRVPSAQARTLLDRLLYQGDSRSGSLLSRLPRFPLWHSTPKRSPTSLERLQFTIRLRTPPTVTLGGELIGVVCIAGSEAHDTGARRPLPKSVVKCNVALQLATLRITNPAY